MSLSECTPDNEDTEHPSLERLNAFAVGQLDEDEFRRVEQHLTLCNFCANLLEDSPSDWFVALLRRDDSHIQPTKVDPDIETDRIGPSRPLRFVPGYTLLEVLGEGGMGVVYKARQDGLNRLVALKRLRSWSMASAHMLSRFRREAESIARLHHANIVQIYDIGEQDGEPYLALEYVAGGSLARKLIDGPLPPRQAAALVETLARAMHHAHEQGILHRDLKPANVLLTEDGSPKIGDFGLAKQLDEATAHTQSGVVLGTPSYMAPEQAGGEGAQLGPTVDVYALGAILYETLTGRPPFRAPTVLETLAQAREREPVPPRQLQPTVPWDVQTICLKCLHKEPGRRYASASELADDLRRFLAGEPIRARPVGRGERLRKWMRRRPYQAALVLLVLLAPLAIVAGLLWHNRELQGEIERTETARRRAENAENTERENYAKARQTIFGMINRWNDWNITDRKNTSELGKGFVRDGLSYVETVLGKEDKGDPQVRSDAAALLHSIAMVQMHMGQREQARSNFNRAFALWEQLAAEQPSNSNHRHHLANGYRIMGRVLPGDARQNLVWAEKSVALAEELCRLNPDDDFDSPILLAQCLHDWAMQYPTTEQGKDAEKLYLRSIDLYAKLLARYPERQHSKLGMADCYCNLGALYYRTRRIEKAEETLQRADALLEQLMKANFDVHGATATRADVANNWGKLYLARGQIDKAIASFNRGLGWCEEILRQEPNYAPARLRALQLHGCKANFYFDHQRFAESAVEWKHVVALAEKGADCLNFRRYLMISLVRSGDSANAATEADSLAVEPGCSSDLVYDCACIYALAGREDKAMSLLQKLKTGGYFDKAENRKMLREDKDLDSLRRRADFRKFQ